MTIEEIIQSTTALALPKKTMLNIIYTQSILADRFNEILKPYDLSSEQFNVLRILRGQKGKPANMCMIQERMIAKTSNTTRLIDKLLIKELVVRATCCENRRKVEVNITEKGLDLLAELDPKIVNYENTLINKLTPEQAIILNELLEKIRN